MNQGKNKKQAEKSEALNADKGKQSSRPQKNEAKQSDGAANEFSRRFKQSPFIFTGTIIILVLVVVSFVFWGAGDWILPKRGSLGESQLTFGRYDDVPIELTPGSYFAQMRQSYIEYYANSFGWRGESAEMQATRQAFQEAVIRTAMFDAAKKARYAPPETLVDKTVSELPKYQENGVFSVLKYRRESSIQHIQTVNSVREDMLIQRYEEDVIGKRSYDNEAGIDPFSGGKIIPAVKSASGEAIFIGQMAKRQRSFSLAVFPYADYPDSMIVSYVIENPGPFKNTHLSQITVSSSEEDAKTLLRSIQDGKASFEDQAKSQSKDSFAANGGDAGERMAYELDALIPSATRDEIVNLGPGALSSVIKTSSGWSIFRAQSAAVPADTSNPAVLEKIRQHLTVSERAIIETWLIARANDFVKDAQTLGFHEAAEKDGVRSYDFGPLAINYGNSPIFPGLSSSPSNSESPELQAAAKSKNFWKTAFSTPPGEASAPFVIDDSLNSVLVIQPIAEIANDRVAEEKARTTFTDTFLGEDAQNSARNAVFTSSKFQDNFFTHYVELFQGNKN